MIDFKSDDGMSLIEVLITLVILGLAGVALLGGLAGGITGSDLHRQQASAQTVLASAGEAIVDESQVPYRACADYTYYDPLLVGRVKFPSNAANDRSWTPNNIRVTKVLYWNGRDFQGTNCYPVLPLQRITIEVTSPNQQVQIRRDFVKAPL